MLVKAQSGAESDRLASIFNINLLKLDITKNGHSKPIFKAATYTESTVLTPPSTLINYRNTLILLDSSTHLNHDTLKRNIQQTYILLANRRLFQKDLLDTNKRK